MRFYIYSAGYNCAQYVSKCIASVQSQTFKEYTHVIVDDHSTDETHKVCASMRDDRTVLYRTSRNIKWLAASVDHCRPKDEDVVVCLDLDDWLPDNNVLARLADTYAKGYWLTYGQYQMASKSSIKGHCKAYPEAILRSRDFRKHNFVASHLRTYKGFLWNKIKRGDFKDWDGKFAEMTYDVAIMMPMMEMCPYGKIRFFEESMYVYNDANPLNDHKRSRELQKKTELWFRSLPKYPELKR